MSDSVDNRRVMPVLGGSGAPNQLLRQQQQQQQESRTPPGNASAPATGGFDRSSFEAPQTLVPVHGVGLDVIGRAPVGTNLYLIAEWSKTHARVGDLVRIKAVLSKGINGAVRVQIFHEVDQRQIWLESVNGFINKGVVSAKWITKNKAVNYDRGSYFFTIIGGRASATSTNRLTLR